MPQERILVAEDENEIRALCVRALTAAGYEVTSVADGVEAVARAHEAPVDLLVTDIRMPRMGGLEAYAALRATQPELAAVVMTGFGTLNAAIDAMRLGVHEFIAKPFTPRDLVSAVERVLTRRRLTEQNARLRALLPLFDLSQLISHSADLRAIPEHAVRIAREVLRADNASLWLVDAERQLTRQDAPTQSAPALLEQPLLDRLLRERQPLVYSADDLLTPALAAYLGGEQLTAAIAMPIVHQGRTLGTLNVARAQRGTTFGEADLEFLSVLATQVGVTLTNARLLQEKEEAYQRLAELDHVKSEFISIASHELRAPLAVILAYAAVLQEETTGFAQEHLEQVVGSAVQLKSVIDEMVSLRRIDTGAAQIELAPVPLAPLIEQTLSELQPLVAAKSQAVVVELGAALPPVRTDAQVLRLIITSLLSNASKFSPEGSTITVSGACRAQHVALAVRDRGEGIPPEEQERIFQRFYQIESSLRRRHGGIGLGLAIAREMAELIDARLEVSSQVGQGSTFSIVLPQG